MSVICGINPVLEALRARNREFDRVIVAKGVRNQRVSEAMREATRRGIPLRFAAREALDRMVGGINHQGLVAVVSVKPVMDLEGLMDKAGDQPLIVVLDGVEDPRNLGAILRTVEAAGGDGVVLPERHSAGLTEVVGRASAGAMEYVRVARVGNLVNALEKLKERGLWVVGFDAAGEQPWHSVDMKRGVALVFGGEGRGIRRLVREHCDQVVALPLLGRVGSINVSVAAGVALYEAVRQRGWIPSHVRPIPSHPAVHDQDAEIVGPRPDDVEEDPGRIRVTFASSEDEDETERQDQPPSVRVLGLDDDETDWSMGESRTRVIRVRSGRRRWFERKRRPAHGAAPAGAATPTDAPERRRESASRQPEPLKRRRNRRGRRLRAESGIAPVANKALEGAAIPSPNHAGTPPEAPQKRRRPRHRRRRRH
jgi:23S rRNA (guanosine2251-2'-O)-methyltransferase